MINNKIGQFQGQLFLKGSTLRLVLVLWLTCAMAGTSLDPTHPSCRDNAVKTDDRFDQLGK